jgi:hypothetical protein
MEGGRSQIRDEHEAKSLARWDRNVVDTEVRRSYDIYVDIMHRVKYNRENPPDKSVRKQIEEYEVDFDVGDDGEDEEMFGLYQPEEFKPGMSEKLQGIDDDVTRKEEWHAFCLAHESAVEARRVPPQIDDWHKSMKQEEAFEREARRYRYLGKSVAAHERFS